MQETKFNEGASAPSTAVLAASVPVALVKFNCGVSSDLGQLPSAGNKPNKACGSWQALTSQILIFVVVFSAIYHSVNQIE
jgi:hypothetical protein